MFREFFGVKRLIDVLHYFCCPVSSISYHIWSGYIECLQVYRIKAIRWFNFDALTQHYSDVIMGSMASQIISLAIVYSTVYSGADQRKHQRTASLAFVRGIHRWPVNSPHKGPVTRKILMTSSWENAYNPHRMWWCISTATTYFLEFDIESDIGVHHPLLFSRAKQRAILQLCSTVFNYNGQKQLDTTEPKTVFRILKFHRGWSLVSNWQSARQAPSHYLNQWWSSSLTHIRVTRPHCI